MGLFGKRREVLDLTKLQKRGILPKQLPETDNEGIVDFTSSSSASSSVPSSSSSSTSSSSAANSFNFLNSLAGASSPSLNSNNNSSSVEASDSDLSGRLRAARRAKLAEFNEMKSRLENVEYKLERLLERLSGIEDKLK